MPAFSFSRSRNCARQEVWEQWEWAPGALALSRGGAARARARTHQLVELEIANLFAHGRLREHVDRLLGVLDTVARLVGIVHLRIHGPVELHVHVVLGDGGLRVDGDGGLLERALVGDALDKWDGHVEARRRRPMELRGRSRKKREGGQLGACEDKKASSSKAEGFSCPRAPCQIARSSTPRPEAPCSPLCSNGGHLGRRQWCVPAAALRPEWAQQEAAALCSERRHGYRARGAQRAAQAGRELARRARRPPAVAASACIGDDKCARVG